jgi:hypothetical protein
MAVHASKHVIAAVAQCRFSLAGKVRISSTNASIRFSSMRAKELSRSSATFLEEMFGIMRPGWSSDVRAPSLQNSAEDIAFHEEFRAGKVSQAAGLHACSTQENSLSPTRSISELPRADLSEQS